MTQDSESPAANHSFDLFLFGAGASYGSGECFFGPDRVPGNPPLGNGCKGLFRALQGEGGVASTIGGALAELFVENFEQGMEQFIKTREEDTTALLREMAAYLVQFQAGPSNLYRQLLDIIGRSGRSFLLVTINYDMLIEDVLGGHRVTIPVYDLFGFRTSFGGLLKIHGSCNFLLDIPPGMLSNVRFTGSTRANIEGPIRPVTREQTLAFCKQEDSLAPAMSVYARGKQVLYGAGYVERQRSYWDSAARAAKTIYVIGLAVNEDDEHIWSTLAASPGRLEYVDPNGERFKRWCAEVKRNDAKHLASTFEETVQILANRLQPD